MGETPQQIQQPKPVNGLNTQGRTSFEGTPINIPDINKTREALKTKLGDGYNPETQKRYDDALDKTLIDKEIDSLAREYFIGTGIKNSSYAENLIEQVKDTFVEMIRGTDNPDEKEAQENRINRRWNELLLQCDSHKSEIGRFLGNEYVLLLEKLNLEYLNDRLTSLEQETIRIGQTSGINSKEYREKMNARDFMLRFKRKRESLLFSVQDFLKEFYSEQYESFIAGFEAEYLFAKAFKEKNDHPIYYSLPDEDRKTKIDWLVYKDGITYAIQVKCMKIPEDFSKDSLIILKESDIVQFFQNYNTYGDNNSPGTSRVNHYNLDEIKRNVLTMSAYYDINNPVQTIVPLYVIVSSRSIKRNENNHTFHGLPNESLDKIKNMIGGITK